MIAIHSLLTENELADEFVAAFQARRFAEKFFYWFPLSVRAWLALCSDGAYRNYVRSRSLIAQSADDLARTVSPGPLEVLSLGSGQGDKDLLLMNALRQRGVRVSYVPVDTSQALLELACQGAMGAGLPAQGIKADFTRPDHLAALAPAPETPPRLVLLLGNTLGAFDPLAEARELRSLLRPHDSLIVDGEIYAAQHTVAGYDNPLTAASPGRRSSPWASPSRTVRSSSKTAWTLGSPACTRSPSTSGRPARYEPGWAARHSPSPPESGST